MIEEDEVCKLFASKSILEIRQTEQSTQDDIEKKKEDLRQMVGERYRDLIEAADTITEMNACSREVQQHCSTLQMFCFNEVPKSVVRKVESKTVALESYMQMSSQVKFLMELSESIWSAIEQGHLIKASYLYIEGNKILRNLHLDGSTSFCPILQWFPVLSQQIQTLDSLRVSVKNKCRQQLKDKDLEIWLLSEAILAIIILEKISLKNVFQEFLNIRFESILSVFNGTKFSDSLTRVKLLEVVSIYLNTISQTHELFVLNTDGLGDNCGLISCVIEKLQAVTLDVQDPAIVKLKISEMFEEKKGWKKFLPQEVDDFAGVITDCNPKDDLSTEYIAAMCKSWSERCQSAIRSGTKDLLSFITSLKDLSVIRELMDSTLKKLDVLEEEDDTAEQTNWQTKCEQILSEKINTWRYLFHEIFLEKCKDLISSAFDNFISEGKNLLSETMNEFITTHKTSSNRAMTDFIWTEETKDISAGTAWNQKSFSQGCGVLSGLEIKTLAVSPQHMVTYQKFNWRIVRILNDVAFYLDLDSIKAIEIIARPAFVMSQDEFVEICRQFETVSEKSIIDTFLSIDKILSNAPPSKGENHTSSDAMLHFALLCRNFCHICSIFKNVCSLSTQSNFQHRTFLNNSNQSAAWKNITDNLAGKSLQLMKQWVDDVVIDLVTTFKNRLSTYSSGGQMFATLPVWDQVSIEEESESGHTMTSNIKVPSTISFHLLQLLNDVSLRVMNVGGHSFDKIILAHISATLLSLVLQSMKHIVDEGVTLSQAWSLQLLFDIKVCHKILHSKKYDSVSATLPKCEPVSDETYIEIVDWLEGFIDPFDLDVFSPYISRNVHACCQRFGVLVGMVTPPGKTEMSYASAKQSSQSSATHNTLTLSPDCGRFSYLPISSRITKSDIQSLPESIKNQLPLVNAFQQLADNESRKQSKLASSLYSKLGALSSSWLSMAGEG